MYDEKSCLSVKSMVLPTKYSQVSNEILSCPNSIWHLGTYNIYKYPTFALTRCLQEHVDKFYRRCKHWSSPYSNSASCNSHYSTSKYCRATSTKGEPVECHSLVRVSKVL